MSDVWRSIQSGQSAVAPVSRFDASEFRSRMAAQVGDFTPDSSQTTGKRLDRFSQFAVAAARQAVEAAGHDGDLAGTDTAVYLGSALGGVAFGEEQHARYLAHGIRAVAPALALSVFAGAGAANVAINLGLRGPAISNANSCASGAIAIGEAFRLIRSGQTDRSLAGGVECPLAPLTFGSFSLIKAMSTRNDDPLHSCRPFDRDRDGFVMGEGASILVLEEWEQARSWEAVLAEIVGYASTNDAHHMTVPRPDGSEAAHAIREALDDAGMGASDVDYINAHATGTVLGDAAEMAALRAVFGEEMPPVSGTKPLHGHALGASPAIETAITVLSLLHGYVPATANLEDVDPACAGNHVSSPGRRLHPKVALCNAFGFGGINASLVLRKAD